jgi:two-component system chemotaxis sensor kinase CheA
MVHGVPVYRLRGHLLPVIHLKRELRLEDPEEVESTPIPPVVLETHAPDAVSDDVETTDGADAQAESPPAESATVEDPPVTRAVKRDEAINIVVLQADDRQFGLVVDSINDTEEIVVKPLGKELKGISIFAGATIMGDGHVALILDVLGLAQRARVVTEAHDRHLDDDQAQASQEAGRAIQSLLVFALGDDERMAIPLIKVARLEEFKPNEIERVGDRYVVQYRGEIMRLIDVSAVFQRGAPVLDGLAGRGFIAGCEATTDTAGEGETGNEDGTIIEELDRVQVVVYTYEGRSIGLVVGRILDVVEDSADVTSDSQTEGTLGSTVIQERVTELVDVEGVVRRVDPLFFDQRETAAAAVTVEAGA